MINVIVPNYKHDHYLPDLIEGMLKQTYMQSHGYYRPDWELLIMHDDPGTKIDDLQKIDKRIKVFSDGKNKGQSARFNQGIINSQFDWVCFMGADDIPMPWKLSILMEQVWKYRDDEPDIIYTDAVQLQQDGTRVYIKSGEFDPQRIRNSNFIVASTVMARTELAKEVLFDEDIHYGEDWLWYNKMHLAGRGLNTCQCQRFIIGIIQVI